MAIENENDLIATYFRYHAQKNVHDDWAWEQVDTIIEESAAEGWSITIALIAAAPSKKALDYVAAGPLEDLLATYGIGLLAAIKDEAKRSKRFRYALAGVWLEEGSAIYQEWDALVRQYRLDEVDPIDNIPWPNDESAAAASSILLD